MKISKPNVLRQDFWQDFCLRETIADFIKLKTFLEGNILEEKLMILDLKKTKINLFCQFTFKLEIFINFCMKHPTRNSCVDE